MKHRIFALLGLLPVIAFVACEKEAPVQSLQTQPELAFHYLPRNIHAGSPEPALIMVQISEPGTVQQIERVAFKLQSPDGNTLLQGLMWDDGKNGDIIAADNVFTFSFVPQKEGLTPGNYTAVAEGQDLTGNSLATVTDTLQVLAGGAGFPPQITAMILPDTLSIVNDTLFTCRLQAEDRDGDLKKVTVEVYLSFALQPFHIFEITKPQAGNEFLVELSTELFTQNRGDYFFRALAIDSAGNVSMPRVAVLHFERYFRNDPPRVLEIMAPDTVSRSQQSTFLLEARVSDPQGLNDIARVLLNTYLPNGDLTDNSPFQLRDDGFGGDRVPGDGIYSQRFQIPSDTPLGTYRFEVQAEDKSGLKSNTENHFLTVIE